MADTKQKLIILFAILILAGFGFAEKASATIYYATGTLISTNLLDGGGTVTSIDSFFASTTLPSASTTLYAQFATSSTSGPWYNAAGTLNGTTSISNGTSSTDLSGLSWSGANFYYKMYFETSDTSATPVLEEIRVDYSTPNTAPNATSVSDSPDPVVVVDSNVTFTGNWTESDAGDNVKMYICDNSSCTNCTYNSTSSCWCYSDDWVTEPTTTDSCVYTAQSSDLGENSYWLGACDGDDVCDATPYSGGTFTVAITSTYWTQSSWEDGATTTVPDHDSNQTGWTYYASSTWGVATGTELTLTATSTASTTENTDTHFNNGTLSTTTVTGSGSSAYLRLSQDFGTCSGGDDYGGGDWTPLDGSTASGTTCNVGTFTIDNATTVTASGTVVIFAQEVNIAGTFSATGTGSAGGYGNQAGSGDGGGTQGYISTGFSICDPSRVGGGGGAYGGNGGNGVCDSGVCNSFCTAGTGGSPTYGSQTAPTDLGSGGGGAYAQNTYISPCLAQASGGAGGGAIKLIVSGTTTINGSILADGGDGTYQFSDGSRDCYAYGGGGSGGSVYIITDTLDGSGTTTADGGDGYSPNGGKGGGGRIAFYFNTNTYTGATSTSAGSGSGSAAAGSYYEPGAVPYYTTGTLTSTTTDLGQASDLTTIEWTATTSGATTTVKFQIRSASTSAGVDSATWYGPTGIGDYYTSTGTVINSIHDGDRYIQYQATLETTDTFQTPQLDEVKINYQVNPTTTQDLTSSPYNTTDSTNIISQLTWWEHLETATTASTTVKLQLRTATGTTNWTYWWGPTATDTDYFTKTATGCSTSTLSTSTQVTCTTIPSEISDGSNDQYIEYKVFLDTTNTVQSPTLYDVILTYGPSNTAPDAPSSLGPSNYIDSSWGNDNTPTLQFTQTDSDATDTVKFTIQISTTSDYSSPVVDYQSGLIAAGSTSFTVGQATSVDSGTYTVGQEGQTLADDSYYWRVMSTDNNNATSSWTTATDTIAFKIDTTSPTNIGISSITANSSSQLTVTAQTAQDSASGLHSTPYWFNETSGNSGASDSTDWQSSTDFVDTGLSPNVQYIYQVKAKDAAGNESSYSATSSKYTLANVPSSLSLTADSQTQITATWQANSNPADNQYYIENTTANTNSGWQTSLSWSSSNLSCGTTYSFRVKAKNGDDTETAFTSTASQATNDCPVGGGGGIPEASMPPAAPPATSQAPQGFSILINDGNKTTKSRDVTLTLNGGPDAQRMAISNFSDFKDAGQELYSQTKEWDLCKGLSSCSDGEYIVYAKFYTQWGQSSPIVSDSIIYKKEIRPPIISPEMVEKISDEAKKISGKVEEIFKKITELVKPKPSELVVPLEEIVPKEAPLVFQGRWNLLSYLWQGWPFEKFVLAPLPREIRTLTEKFPQLEKTFSQVEITRMVELKKLKGVELSLAGLTETVGLPMVKVEPGKLALPQGIPVAQLPSEIKEKIPTEIVFAKTGGEKIDFNITLTIDEEGKPQQRITTISGKPLNLVVKPDKPVKSIKGYLIFKAKKPEPSSFQLPLQSLTASLFFANPVFAQPITQPVEVEERLVLIEFEYTDPDEDGIYTADIQAPIVEGEYEIITVMNYQDPTLGMKEIRLITVVDPEGYVYERIKDQELRISGAIISLYWLNPETKQYQLWPAKEFQQENPQITGLTGKYSFLAPQGLYYLKVEAPGYLPYQGKSFEIKEGSGIHTNIELKTKFWYLKIFDWRTTLLILVILLLLYNFYRDKIRERRLEKSKKNYAKTNIK